MAALLGSLRRCGKRWPTDVFIVLSEQTLVVSGTGTAGIVLPELAAQLVPLRTSRAQVLARVEELVEDTHFTSS